MSRNKEIPKPFVMTHKKNPRYSLESRRNYFFQFGLVIGLALTLVAFEWTTFEIRKEQTFVSEWVGGPEPPPPGWTPPPPADDKPVVKEQFDETFIVDEDESDDQESEDSELNLDLGVSNLFGDSEGYSDDGNVPDPPNIPVNVWEVDDLPYLCECAHITDSLEREMCTRAGIKESLGSLRVPPIWMDAGGTHEVLYARFIIDVDGRITDVIFADEEEKHPSLIREAKGGLNDLPCFMPAMAGDEPVPMYYSLPITFQVH